MLSLSDLVVDYKIMDHGYLPPMIRLTVEGLGQLQILPGALQLHRVTRTPF